MGCETSSSNTVQMPAYNAQNVPQNVVNPPKPKGKNGDTVRLDVPVRLQW